MLLYLKSLLYIEMLLVVGILLFRAALAPANRDIIGPKAIGLTMLTPAVALLSGNVFVFYGYLATAVAFTSRTRSELCATYLMLLPMTPALSQLTSAGGTYLLPISTISAMNFGALLGFIFTSSKRTLSRPMLDLGALLLVALFVFIDSRGVSATSIARTCVIFFLQLGIPYLVMSRGVANREQLDRIFLRFAFAGTLCALVATFETTRHWILYQSFNDALHLPLELGSATLAMRGGRLRTGGMMLDYTAAGIFLASVLVIMPGLWQQFRRGWLVLLSIVLLAGLFATQSRGAWIAMAVGIVAITFYRGHVARGFGLLTAAAAAQAVVTVVLPSTSKLAETLGTGGAAAQTGEYRKRLLSRGLDQIVAHPLAGQPPRQLASNLPDLVQGQHIVDFVNTHLYVAMAAGLPWFVLWCLIWATPLALAWRNRPGKQYRGIVDPAEMPMAIIVTTLIALTFTSAVDRNLTWPTIALGLMGSGLALRRSATQAYVRSRQTPATVELPEQTSYGERDLYAPI